MRLEISTAPHIRTGDTSKKMIGDVIIALLPLCFMAFYYYGGRSSLIILQCILASWVTDRLLSLLRPRKFIKADFSSVVTGMIVALMMPASVPYWLPISCCIFAIAVVKHPFGGFGNNPFNPAAAAVALAMVCFPSLMFKFPVPLDRIDFSGEVMVKLVDSSASILKLGGIPALDEVEVLLGKQAGPMGVTNILVITACLIFLLVRKTVSLCTVGPLVGVCALSALLTPRTVAGSGLSSLFFELTSGSLLFCAVFVASDPVTSPNTRIGRVVFGSLAGGFTMLLRQIGAYEEGTLFAILLLNSLSGFFDLAVYSLCRQGRAFLVGKGKSRPMKESKPQPEELPPAAPPPASSREADDSLSALKRELSGLSDPLGARLAALDAQEPPKTAVKEEENA